MSLPRGGYGASAVRAAPCVSDRSEQRMSYRTDDNPHARKVRSPIEATVREDMTAVRVALARVSHLGPADIAAEGI